jgi:asparagine synthetase B (glutamine-hydrolysing)
MTYADGVWITFNGGITTFWNAQCSNTATAFTESDTEVVMAAYDRWGELSIAPERDVAMRFGPSGKNCSLA